LATKQSPDEPGDFFAATPKERLSRRALLAMTPISLADMPQADAAFFCPVGADGELQGARALNERTHL
jgi:hypothetical protein